MTFVDHAINLVALASEEEIDRWQHEINPDKPSYLNNLESMVERAINQHEAPVPDED